MKKIPQTYRWFAVAGLAIACVLTARAQPYYVSGSGLTPSWTPGAPENQMTGGPTVFTLSTATTGTPYHDFKITGASWSDPNWPGNNARTKPDANGSNTFYFFPGITADGWNPINNRVGYADPGNLTFEIVGDFNNWGAGVAYPLNALGNGVYSNSIVVDTAGTYGFKFRTPGTWNEINFGADFGNGGANGSFTTTNSPQTVPVQLDLPNGRWLVGQLAPPPVTNQVVFAVDMSSQISVGNFVPGVDKVFVSGAFNSWPGTGGSALLLTNNPVYQGNTNIYYATNVFYGAPGSPGSDFKFTCNNAAFSGANGYEPRANNRSFNLMSTNGVLLLPVVSFGDVYTSEYLASDVLVTFTVNMTNAVTSTNSPSALNSGDGTNIPHPFDPLWDTVIINGNFLIGGWTGWNTAVNPMTPITDQQVYQFTALVPKGSPLRLQYKYGIQYASNPATNSILDNEAATAQDHVRYIRTTPSGTYVLPMDTFSDQHVEPSFGQLTLAPATAGNVNLSWLGRPGVHVQSSSNLVSWVDHLETDGTNWTSGTSSRDGFLSSTNWPKSGSSQFFRLIKP